jgi:hypothetical protein
VRALLEAAHPDRRTELAAIPSERAAVFEYLRARFQVTNDGQPCPTVRDFAVVDQDQSALTQRIVAAMKADPSFDLRDPPLATAIEQVRGGKIRGAIVFPKGFGERAPRAMLVPGAKPEIEIHVDPSQAVALALVKGLLAQHVMREVSKAASALAGGTAFEMPFTTKEHEVTSGEAPYNGYAHSFAGMGVQFILFSGIDLGIAVLLMRRLGLWKRLRAAPVSRRLLLGSRVASGATIAFLLMTAIYAAGNGPRASMPSALRRSTAGRTTVRSSSPSAPSSPACGLSPAMARRGRAMSKRSRRSRATMRPVSTTRPSLSRAVTSFSARWIVTGTTASSGDQSIMTG